MARRPNPINTPSVTPVPRRCKEPAMFIPAEGYLERPVSVFGDFNAGVTTKVEIGAYTGNPQKFVADPKVTHPAPPAKMVTATQIDIVLKVESGADDGLKYVSVTQGTAPHTVTGFSGEGIFTLVQSEG